MTRPWKIGSVATAAAVAGVASLSLALAQDAPPALDAEKQVLNELHLTNNKEMRLAELAIERSETPLIRAYAERLYRDHRQADRLVQDLADELGVPLEALPKHLRKPDAAALKEAGIEPEDEEQIEEIDARAAPGSPEDTRYEPLAPSGRTTVPPAERDAGRPDSGRPDAGRIGMPEEERDVGGEAAEDRIGVPEGERDQIGVPEGADVQEPILPGQEEREPVIREEEQRGQPRGDERRPFEGRLDDEEMGAEQPEDLEPLPGADEAPPAGFEKGTADTRRASAKKKNPIDELRALSGAAFDERFLELMLEDHTKTVTMLEGSLDRLQTEQARDLVQKLMPILNQHRELARALRQPDTYEVDLDEELEEEE